jgi:bifunctional DNA-binding transcriptional regulator/antitoxin component of YhaV-PrlF toxin-antitoxin module
MPSKLYKSTKGKDKLVLYIPSNVVEKLGLKDGDLVDFVPYDEKSFIFMTLSDISERVKGKDAQPQQKVEITPVPAVHLAAQSSPNLSADELSILRKLDTIKYANRTMEKVDVLLNDAEKQLLQKLLDRKVVSLYRKQNEAEAKYGISPSAYMLIMRKKILPQRQQQKDTIKTAAKDTVPAQPKKWEKTLEQGNTNVQQLETRGFVVLSNEVDAANVSAAVEESIRRGLVVGTRAFNKKYYIALKSYVLKNASRILPMISSRSLPVQDIAKGTGMEEDGIRSILYILAETGEVSETRRDYFKAVL